METKVFRHTKKVFIWDAILCFIIIGFFTAVIHLLRLFSEKLIIDEKHVKLKTGILSNNETDIPFDKINTIAIRQGLLGKILNYGSIVIFTGNDTSGILFGWIDKPKEIKAEIQSRLITL